MEKLCIELENPHAFSKIGELFRIGIPFPSSLLFKPENLVLLDQNSRLKVPFSYQVTANWPDSSIKWILLSFCLDLDAGQIRSLGLQLVDATGAGLSDESSAIHVEWATKRLALPVTKHKSGQSLLSVQSAVKLFDADGQQLNEVITEQAQERFSGHLENTAHKQTGRFRSESNGSEVDFISLQEWLPAAGLLKWQFTLWNKQAAKHPGGCWDLGDQGSVLFNSLDLCLQTEATDSKVFWRSHSASEFEQATEAVHLVQSGSACKVADPEHPAFNRNIHKNSKGEVAATFNGSEITRGANSEQLALRASPEIFLASSTGAKGAQTGLAIALANFWQNFPKALSIDKKSIDKQSIDKQSIDERPIDERLIQLALFPSQNEPYELQAGERKTHTFYFCLTDEADSLAWVNAPSNRKILPEWFALCGSFSYLSCALEQDSLAPFINQGIEGPESFIAKRERIDEYGWRHFGDVYADHECRYQQAGDVAFVSHYNNQYDAIYGYARQYAQTGDSRWYQLMDELARHVADIDIYHTEQDRVEYNNGMFWHTDHYLDAQTCTHRTFSRHNQTSSTPGQTGGGPGSEHCYTTGLRYHYLMCGYEPSKEAVIKLADWMIATQAGAKSFLAQVLSAKNQELKKLLALFNGQPVSVYRYPFTRGTGNFMVALMDAYDLTAQETYLLLLERVIRESVHPKDDIALRNLSDIENTWSYTVFLQALVKYLSLKESLNQNDAPYAYARASFMHYAEWMLEHERPYLSRPEVLEFPNDTWVAQEIRKLALFVSAAQYDHGKKDVFSNKAKEFFNYIVIKLATSQEKHFSRIQILLLQSYGPHLYCQTGSPELPAIAIKPPITDFGPAPKASALKFAWAIMKKIVKGLKYFSPANERQWIKTRVG